MFDLLDRPLLYIPVKWPGLAVEEGGAAKTVEHTVEIQVEILDRPAMAEWLKKGGEDADLLDENAGTEQARADELATFKAVAKGWRGLKLRGREAPFTDENVALLLGVPNFVGAFGAAYFRAWQGRLETREGNSDGSPASGQAGEPTAETPTAETSRS